ncbi:MAG: hypothetical protein M3P85_04875 [Actinomycetota bacterium]|nr:hypothetical protein [Actinomycetota bacterium]
MSAGPQRRRHRLLVVVVTATVVAATLGLGSARPAAAGPCDVLPCPPVVDDVIDTASRLMIPGADAATKVIDSVTGLAGGAVASVATGILDVIGRGIADAVGRLFSEVSEFFTASSSPDVTVASFVGKDGAYHKLAQLSALVMILFIFFGVIQGVVAGDPLAMIGRTLRNVPLAVLAIFGFPWLVDQLVGLVDAVCVSLLPTGSTLGTIAKVYAVDQMRFGVPAILLLLFAFLAGVAIYAELVVRAALVTLVVALAPLSFAAMVWPATRGAARKAVELVAALVLSKLAIWVALAVGIGLFETHANSTLPGGQSFGQMISGAAVLAVAVFAPFVVWRLIPVVEAAAVAHGLSRMPSRAAMTAAQTATTLRMLSGGGGGGGGRAAAPGRDDEHPALADLPSRSLGVPGGQDGSGPSASTGSAGGGTGGSGASGARQPAGAGTAVGAGAGAAGVVAAPVLVGADAARRAKDGGRSSVEAHSQGRGDPLAGHGGWSFRADEGGG